MIAARRDESRFGSTPLHQLEAQDTTIKGKRPFQVGDLEVHVTDAHAVSDWSAGHRIGQRPQLVDRIAHQAVPLLSVGAGGGPAWRDGGINSKPLGAAAGLAKFMTCAFAAGGGPARPSRNAAKLKVMWCTCAGGSTQARIIC